MKIGAGDTIRYHLRLVLFVYKHIMETIHSFRSKSFIRCWCVLSEGEGQYYSINRLLMKDVQKLSLFLVCCTMHPIEESLVQYQI